MLDTAILLTMLVLLRQLPEESRRDLDTLEKRIRGKLREEEYPPITDSWPTPTEPHPLLTPKKGNTNGKERKPRAPKQDAPSQENADAGEEYTTVVRDGKTYKRRKRRWHKKPAGPEGMGPKPIEVDQPQVEDEQENPAPHRPGYRNKPKKKTIGRDPLLEICDGCQADTPMRYPCLDCGVNICEACAKKGNLKKHQCRDCSRRVG